MIYLHILAHNEESLVRHFGLDLPVANLDPGHKWEALCGAGSPGPIYKLLSLRHLFTGRWEYDLEL